MARAVVLGGGIAGLAAAIALGRAGWTVSVHERAAAIEPLGAAISLWSNALAALDRLGVGDQVTAASAPIRTLLIADHRGTPIVGPRPVHGRAVLTTRATLQRILCDALPRGVSLHLAQEVERVEQDGRWAAAHFSSGQSVTADIVVDASGLRSVVAGAWSATPARYAGYGGVMALSDPIGTADLHGLAAEYWGADERFGVFALPEGRRYWFYMQRCHDGTAPAELGTIAERAGAFPPAVAAAVAATPSDRLIAVSMHARPAPRALGNGRVIAVGDAAHAMEPNLGQGACQALEDAVALGVVAARVPPGGMLRAFEALRLRRVRFVVRRAAEGRHGPHGPPLVQATARALLRHAPDVLTAGMIRATQTMPDYA